jgi:UDP-N-acetylmuramoyl-tripeptide--D-alanyl-D-alanine ligase
MRAALDALVQVTPRGKRKVAVLGDMLELGPAAAELHAEVGAYAVARADELIAVGPLARHIADGARSRGLADASTFYCEDPLVAAKRVLAASGPGDVILVKASRGMRLERVIEALSAEAG